MPIVITMDMLGIPHDATPFFLSVAEGIMHSTEPEVQQAAFNQVFAYLSEKIIPLRRENPSDNIISALVRGKTSGGRALNDGEILGLCTALITAGLDTIANMLGVIILFLARNSAHR